MRLLMQWSDPAGHPIGLYAPTDAHRTLASASARIDFDSPARWHRWLTELHRAHTGSHDEHWFYDGPHRTVLDPDEPQRLFVERYDDGEQTRVLVRGRAVDDLLALAHAHTKAFASTSERPGMDALLHGPRIATASERC